MLEKSGKLWELFEILVAAQLPGTTSAPRLQPIAARIVMLQSGMRAPMGVKIRGQDLDEIERVGLDVERLLKEVEGVDPASVFADRIIGKPYLEIETDIQTKAARFQVSLKPRSSCRRCSSVSSGSRERGVSGAATAPSISDR